MAKARSSADGNRDLATVTREDEDISPAAEEIQLPRRRTEAAGAQQIQRLFVAVGIFCSLGATVFRFFYLWQQFADGGRGSPWWLTIQVSVLLMIEACLLAMAVLLVLIVPPLIVTWTTAVVFEFIFRHLVNIFGNPLSKTESETVRYFTSNDRLRRNGMRIAKEMLGINAIGAGIVTLCFISTFYLRNYLRYI